MGSRRRPPVWGLRIAVFAAVFAGAFASAPLARADAIFTNCHLNSPVGCAFIPVPLDYSGKTIGQIALSLEKLDAPEPRRGVVLLVAGGPGQPSAKVFDLARNGSMWQEMFPGYTVAAYDNRGTGNSGPLVCNSLLKATANFTDDQVAALVGQCGDALGPGKGFYTTADHAEDIEAVRRALGADRIALWGTSYGTKQVLAYAATHPEHVERLVLDSVVPLNGPDPLGGETLRGIPLAIGSLCSGGACRSATSNPVGDVVKLANRLAAKPLALSYRGRSLGKLDGVGFLQLVESADLNPGVAAELPAAVAAALAGRWAPLQHIAFFGMTGGGGGGSDDGKFNVALLLATTCSDGGFPWRSDSAPATRQAVIDGVLAGLPSTATGPFGAWAAAMGSYPLCKSWPAFTPLPPMPIRPFPNVPVLLLSGDFDMRTPTANARAVAAAFPQAQLLVVPGVGHSVLTSDYSYCATRGLLAWLNGRKPSACARVTPLAAPLAAFPASVKSLEPAAKSRGLSGRTLTAVRRTLREAQAAWLAVEGGGVPGIYGGALMSLDGLKFQLQSYSVVPGVAVSGTITIERGKRGHIFGGFSGTVTVSGSEAAHGTLELHGSGMSGRLAARH